MPAISAALSTAISAFARGRCFCRRWSGRWGRACRWRWRRLCRPGTQIVAFVGDGGTLMSGNEIATAVQYGASPIMIISDNGMYGTIGMHSYVRYPERAFMEGTRLTNPDFAAWGRSFGAEGITIREESEVADG